MACVGRTKECTIVPSNHYGPIPGVPVGTTWKFRVQVSWGYLSIYFFTVYDNQIYFEHLKKIMSHSVLLFLLPCIPLR